MHVVNSSLFVTSSGSGGPHVRFAFGHRYLPRTEICPQLYRVEESSVRSEKELSCILYTEDDIWCVTYRMEKKAAPWP